MEGVRFAQMREALPPALPRLACLLSLLIPSRCHSLLHSSSPQNLLCWGRAAWRHQGPSSPPRRALQGSTHGFSCDFCGLFLARALCTHKGDTDNLRKQTFLLEAVRRIVRSALFTEQNQEEGTYLPAARTLATGLHHLCKRQPRMSRCAHWPSQAWPPGA